MAKFPFIGELIRFLIIDFDVYKTKKDKNIQAKIEKIYKEDEISLEEYNKIVLDIFLYFFKNTLGSDSQRIEKIMPIIEEYLLFYRRISSSIPVYSLTQQQLLFILYKDFFIPIIAKSIILIIKENIPSFIEKVLKGNECLVSSGIEYIIDEKIIKREILNYIDEEYKKDIEDCQKIISMNFINENVNNEENSNEKFFLIFFKFLSHIYKSLKQFDKHTEILLKEHLVELVNMGSNDYKYDCSTCRYEKEKKYLKSKIYSEYLDLYNFNISETYAIFSDKIGRGKYINQEDELWLTRYKEYFSDYYINSKDFFHYIDYFLAIKYFDGKLEKEYIQKKKEVIQLKNKKGSTHKLLELHSIIVINKEQSEDNEKLADRIISKRLNEDFSLLDKLVLARYYALKNNFNEARKYYRNLLIEGKNSLGEEYVNVINEGIRAEAENKRLIKVDLVKGSSNFRKYYIQAVYSGLWKYKPKKQSGYLLHKLKEDIKIGFIFFPSVTIGKPRKVKNVKLDLKNPLVSTYLDIPITIPQLFCFAYNGEFNNVKKLLKNKADVDYIEPTYQSNILFFTREHQKISTYLISKLKLDTLNKKMINGNTILFFFICQGDIKLIKELLNREVSVEEDVLFQVFLFINIHAMSYNKFLIAKSFNESNTLEEQKEMVVNKMKLYSNKTFIIDKDNNDFFDTIMNHELDERAFKNYKKKLPSKKKLYRTLDLMIQNENIDSKKVYENYIDYKNMCDEYNMQCLNHMYFNQELEEYLKYKS
jgi:hypothetical protein